MNNAKIFLMIMMPLLSGCSTASHQESPAVRLEQEFLQTDFTIQTHTASLNRHVMALLGSMADPGEAYNHIDAVNLKLPMAGLIFAGEARNMTFVLYSQGGIAETKRLFLAELNDAQDVVHACIWRLEGAGTYQNAEELKKDFPAGFRKESCLR
jgi:hypothetical protein